MMMYKMLHIVTAPSHLTVSRLILWLCILHVTLTQSTFPTSLSSAILNGSLASSDPPDSAAATTASVATVTTQNLPTTTLDSTNETSTEITFSTSSLQSNTTPTPGPAAVTDNSVTTVALATTAGVTTIKKSRSTTKIADTSTMTLPKTRPTTNKSLISLATTKGVDVNPSNKSLPPASTNHVALYLLLPLVIMAGMAVLFLIGSYLRKKIRLDKLRHQLLPMYNFDPQEGEDWETELLTDPNKATSQTPLNAPPKQMATTVVIAEIPKLRFSSDSVDV